MSKIIFSLIIVLLFLTTMGLAKKSSKKKHTPTVSSVLPIPVEGIPIGSMNQTYERQLGNQHMYAYLLNNCRKIDYNKKFRITNLTLTYSVNVSVAATFQIISYQVTQDDGLLMYYLREQDGEALYGVENEDFGFDAKMSSAATDKKVVYKRTLKAGTTAGKVAVETQKFYNSTNMVFVMIKTPTDPIGMKYFMLKREMHYIVDQ